MPLSLTYPGVYIQELPGPPPTIAAAPTSIAVFLGYTHPYKTLNFGQAVEIFSIAGYQQAFGDIYSNTALDATTAYAVQQFFLNGGSNAYVVGLQAAAFSSWTLPQLPPPVSPKAIPELGQPPSGGPFVTYSFSSASAGAGGGAGTGAAAGAAGGASATATPVVTFWSLEPIDQSHQMTVTLSKFTSSASNNQLDTFDVKITYGSTPYGSVTSGTVVETFGQVSLVQAQTPPANPNFIETRINGNSQLVWVSPPTGQTAYNVFLAAPLTPSLPLPVPTTEPVFSASDFTAAFGANGPLEQIPIFNLMVIPGNVDSGVWGQAIPFCESKRAFLICDPPEQDDAVSIQDFLNSGALTPSINAALYFPWLNLSTIDPLTGLNIPVPPSGTVAGIFARTDSNRGVWKAPAGLETVINNVTGVMPSGVLTDNLQGVLNPLGVNCLRTFPGSGTVVFGARTTTTADPALQQWRYVPVRRMALFIEQSLYAALGWVVFEPNDTPLWTAITTSVNAFMLTLFNQNAFQGAKASDAFQVVCDSTTTTQTDINNGIVNILVAFAPLKPAEFVVIQIAQLAGQAQS